MRLLTTSEVAAGWGSSSESVRRAIKEGRLPAFDLGNSRPKFRIDPSDAMLGDPAIITSHMSIAELAKFFRVGGVKIREWIDSQELGSIEMGPRLRKVGAKHAAEFLEGRRVLVLGMEAQRKKADEDGAVIRRPSYGCAHTNDTNLVNEIQTT